MGSQGVDGLNTNTNHIIEIERTLGVEAAHTSISEEIFCIMSIYGIGIDSRHLLLFSVVTILKVVS